MNILEFSFHIILHLGIIHNHYIGCDGYDSESSITGLYTGPYFDPLTQKNISAHLGDRAVLPCTVRQLGDKAVSWVRVHDADILTVNNDTFISDDRFKAKYSAMLDTWHLFIKYVQERDAGRYECQVSTQPKMSQIFNLRIVVPQVRISPHGDRFVKEGSEVQIECHITDVVKKPDYIFWYLNGVRVLDTRNPNIQIIAKTTGVESLLSTLTIFRVRRDDSGNYTCMPSNLYAASAHLHVLNEEHPAAMQDGKGHIHKMDPLINLLLILIVGQLLFQVTNECSITWMMEYYKNIRNIHDSQRKHRNGLQQINDRINPIQENKGKESQPAELRVKYHASCRMFPIHVVYELVQTDALKDLSLLKEEVDEKTLIGNIDDKFGNLKGNEVKAIDHDSVIEHCDDLLNLFKPTFQRRLRC